MGTDLPHRRPSFDGSLSVGAHGIGRGSSPPGDGDLGAHVAALVKQQMEVLGGSGSEYGMYELTQLQGGIM
jgi:hypothetical protein